MIVSNMAIGLCFVPFLFLRWKKMRQETAYWIVGIYWLANGLINLPNLELSGHFMNYLWQNRFIHFYKLLDTPLVLLIFFYGSSRKERKPVLVILALFIALEVALLTWNGYNLLSSTTIIGTGLLVVLVFSIKGFSQYLKKMEHTDFENSMVFVFVALLFAYCGFTIIYIFSHIHTNTEASDNRDSLFLYYISLSLSATITCLGLWGYGIRAPGLRSELRS
jgi:hypothetical protein